MFPFHTWLPDAHNRKPPRGLRHPRRRPAENGQVMVFLRFSLPLLPADPSFRARIIHIVIVALARQHHLRRRCLPICRKI